MAPTSGGIKRQMFWETGRNWHGETSLSSWIHHGDKPVMAIPLPLARKKDGTRGSIRKADWAQIMSCLECIPRVFGA